MCIRDSLTIEQGVLEKAYADMNMLVDFCDEHHDFEVFIKSPVVKTHDKLSVINKLFSGKVDKVTETFLNLITTKRREEYLLLIAKEFIRQYKEKKNILTAIVTSASGIDDSIRKEITKIVKGDTDSEVVMEESVNEDLIGGIIIRVGDKQVDASIARKLKNLRKDFNESPFTAN